MVSGGGGIAGATVESILSGIVCLVEIQHGRETATSNAAS